MATDRSFGQFEIVFRQSPVATALIDRDTRILLANDTIAELLGRPEAELRDRPFTDYIQLDERERLGRAIDALAVGDTLRTFVGAPARSNGRAGRWWVDVGAVALPDRDRTFVVAITDVTSQHEDEERLRKAKESAEAATVTKSAFLANMSHEIRTPLHTINGMAHLLSETELNAEQHEYLHQISFAGDVLLELVNDILDISKVEAGQLELERIHYEPVRTIESAVDMVSMQAHRKGLEMVLSIDPSLPKSAVGDPTRLRQIVVNLVGNAIKFTADGFIRVSATRLHTDGDTLAVHVVDTGIGVPRDLQPRLFKPFSQVDASMTRKYGGTGLGLSISSNLVRLMAGRIGVTSESGHGSDFWFEVPLHDASRTTVAVSGTRALELGSRVLIIDDNAVSSQVVAAMLRAWSYRVAIAADASEATALLQSARQGDDRFALALVDLRLPTIDGWQLAQQIRGDERFDDLGLILMSPAGMSSGEPKMKLLGWFNAYLSKPVKTAELGQAIDWCYGDELEEFTAAGSDAAPTDETTPVTALVVEDHFVNRQLFQTILEKRGHRVFTAENGQEAVAAVQTNFDISVVFMDVQMPVMNGLDATRRIRELGFQMPIVAVIANAMAEDYEACLAAGMNDYVAKPFQPSDIDAALQRAATGTGRAAPHTDGNQPPATAEHEPPPIDFARTVASFLGDVPTAERVVRDFAARVQHQLAEVGELADNGRYTDARVIAHAVKGGAWNLRCGALGDAAEALEAATLAADPHAIARALPRAEHEAKRYADYVAAVDLPATIDTA